MNAGQARRLVKMAVVMWDEDPNDKGTVLEVGASGFFVEWENGQRGWIDYEDAGRVSLWYP